jgi:hypothetical protein
LNRITKNNKGKKFSLIRKQALLQLDGSGDKYSDSMKEAVKALKEAKCLM